MFGSTTQVPVGALASVLRYSALDTSLLAYRVTAQPDCKRSLIGSRLMRKLTELQRQANLPYRHFSGCMLPNSTSRYSSPILRRH